MFVGFDSILRAPTAFGSPSSSTTGRSSVWSWASAASSNALERSASFTFPLRRPATMPLSTYSPMAVMTWSGRSAGFVGWGPRPGQYTITSPCFRSTFVVASGAASSPPPLVVTARERSERERGASADDQHGGDDAGDHEPAASPARGTVVAVRPRLAVRSGSGPMAGSPVPSVPLPWPQPARPERSRRDQGLGGGAAEVAHRRRQTRPRGAGRLRPGARAEEEAAGETTSHREDRGCDARIGVAAKRAATRAQGRGMGTVDVWHATRSRG